jgi:hypothetical protein
MMMGFGLLGLLLLGGVLVALLAGGAALLRQTGGFDLPGGKRQPTAREVLDKRLARGEISSEEYEAIRAQIESYQGESVRWDSAAMDSAGAAWGGEVWASLVRSSA